MIVAETVECEDIATFIKKEGSELVEEVKLFDLYQGEGVPKGKRSLAFSVSYRASNRTLTSEEINLLHERISRALALKFKAKIRDR